VSERRLRALVVDDEPVARRRLQRMLARLGDVDAVGEAGDGAEALAAINALSPDVVFLDVRMPGMDGLAVATGDHPLPPIVFVTAFDQHAVDAFEAGAVDYLLKPVREERLRRALDRVRARLAADETRDLRPLLESLSTAARPPRIAARQGATTRLFDPREIARIQALDKYASFQLDGARYLLDESLTALEQRLARWGFLLVHRSELVNLARVKALRDTGRGWLVELADGQRAPVSRRRLVMLRRELGLER
jgi:two-component system LytT family response regulator